MEHCKIKWLNEKTVQFVGAFDEYASFVDVVAGFPAEVWIDFAGVTTINSLGVREWSKALLGTRSRLHYINCPSIVIDQFNSTPEFIGQNASIDSMEIFFACDECDYTTSDIFEVGKGKALDPDLEDFVEKLEPKCLRCGDIMEVDHEPDIYFQLFRT